MTEIHTPRVLWAQRQDRVFVTIEVADVKADSVKVELASESLSVKAKNVAGEEFAVALDFFAPVDAGASQQNLTGRYPTFVLMKADNEPSWWPRLIKSTNKPHYIHTDFAKWVDEDDISETFGQDDDGMMYGGGNDFDMSQFMSQYQGGEDDENDSEEDHDNDGGEMKFDEDAVKEVDLEAERAKFKSSQ